MLVKMLKNKESIWIVRRRIRKVLDKLDSNDRLRFDAVKRSQIKKYLKRLEEAVSNDPDTVFPLYISLKRNAKIYAFEKDLQYIMRVFKNMHQNLIVSEKSLAYI